MAMRTDGFPKLTFWRGLFVLLLGMALYATWVRFARGLGAATHLTDAFPWGLWIGFDVLVGVGLAAGGFVIAATVHIFGVRKYEPIARPSVVTAFLGYLLVIVALLFDLGRPYRIWHPLVMWNPHSVMFEVAWCVMLYTAVLAIEFSPILFERLGWRLPLKLVRGAFVPLVIVGVLLSTLHQSSLGTLYVIVPDKLHGLWYTPFLPIFFFISAIAGGLAITIFESFMSYRAFGRRLDSELLQGLGRVIVVVLAVYAVWRAEDLVARKALGLAFQVTPESVLFWGEVGLGVLLPMVLFAIPAVQRNDQGLFFAAMLTLMGFVINRLNVSITGMQGWSGANYFPSWMELAVTTAIVASGFVLFGMAVRYLPVFPAEAADDPPGAIEGKPAAMRHRPVFHGGVLAVLWLLLFVGAAAVLVSMKLANANRADAGARPFAGGAGDQEAAAIEASAGGSATQEPALAEGRAVLSFPADYTFGAGGESPGPVVFSHKTHVDPANPRCGACHATLFRLHEPGRPLAGELSGDRMHEQLCGSCHNGQVAFRVDENCDVCHRE
jgi:c(7)-type cytochrome triheme protein